MLLPEEEESEYETESEEELIGITMWKPKFVPKSDRETMVECERMAAAECAVEVM